MTCGAANRDGITALSEVSPSGLSVRVVPANALQSFVHPEKRGLFERTYGRVPEQERKRMLYILGLADGVMRRDARAMRAAVRRYMSDVESDGIAWDLVAWDEVRKSPLYELHIHLNKGLKRLRFIVWWAERERRMVSGLLATDAAEALWALVLSKMGQPGGLGLCQRKNCGNVFIRMRSTQRFCGYKCQAAAGMTRLRAKSMSTTRGR